MNDINALNTGIILRKAQMSRAARGSNRKTIIVTGIARSGTTLVASLLRSAGVHMGTYTSHPND